MTRRQAPRKDFPAIQCPHRLPLSHQPGVLRILGAQRVLRILLPRRELLRGGQLAAGGGSQKGDGDPLAGAQHAGGRNQGAAAGHKV